MTSIVSPPLTVAETDICIMDIDILVQSETAEEEVGGVRDCRQTACRCRRGAAPLPRALSGPPHPIRKQEGGRLSGNASVVSSRVVSLACLTLCGACAPAGGDRARGRNHPFARHRPAQPLRALCSAAPDAASSSSTPAPCSCHQCQNGKRGSRSMGSSR